MEMSLYVTVTMRKSSSSKHSWTNPEGWEGVGQGIQNPWKITCRKSFLRNTGTDPIQPRNTLLPRNIKQNKNNAVRTPTGGFFLDPRMIVAFAVHMPSF